MRNRPSMILNRRRRLIPVVRPIAMVIGVVLLIVTMKSMPQPSQVVEPSTPIPKTGQSRQASSPELVQQRTPASHPVALPGPTASPSSKPSAQAVFVSSNPPPFEQPKDGSTVYDHLCILSSPPRKQVFDANIVWNITKRLVVFHAPERRVSTIDANRAFEAGGSAGKFEVHFEPGPPPSVLVSNSTAFFIGSTCEANIDHFFYDEFLVLFSTMMKCNVLEPQAKVTEAGNRVFYSTDLHSFDRKMGPNGGYCHNPEQFEPLIQALRVDQEPQVYWGKNSLWGEPSDDTHFPDICFHRAVFVRGVPASPNQAMAYVARASYVPNATCQPSTTVVQRGSSRRIVNLEADLHLLEDMHFPNVRVVRMEQLGVIEQLRVVRTSGVYIGSFGAALAWSGALHPQALLVEFLWPDLPKRYVYSCVSGWGGASKWGTCVGRYGARAGYVRVGPNEVVDNPNLKHVGGKASKLKDLHVDIPSLRNLLEKAFPSVESRQQLPCLT